MNEGVILGDAPEQQVVDYKPTLEGLGEEKVIAVYNPLPHDFRVVFARQQAYRPTPDANMQFAREKGLPLDKANPKAYATQDVILPAGKIKNLPGDIAQIAVRKLTSAIIQTRNEDGSYDFSGHGGSKGMVPDPHRRSMIEQEIVKGVYDATSFFNQEIPQLTPQESTTKQIESMNDPVTESLSNEAPDPAPGTGVSYTPAANVSSAAGPATPSQPADNSQSAAANKGK